MTARTPDRADAVLLTCSMYGPVAVEAAAQHPVPVLASDHLAAEVLREQLNVRTPA